MDLIVCRALTRLSCVGFKAESWNFWDGISEPAIQGTKDDETSYWRDAYCGSSGRRGGDARSQLYGVSLHCHHGDNGRDVARPNFDLDYRDGNRWRVRFDHTSERCGGRGDRVV